MCYKLISSKDESLLHELDEKMLPGVFMVYVIRPRGGWSSDLLLADLSVSEITLKDDTKRSHKNKICRFHVRTDSSNSSIILTPPPP